MSFTSIGDLSVGLTLKTLNARLKGQARQLGVELSSGQVSDIARHLQGRLQPYSESRRAIAAIDRYLDNAAEQQQVGAAIQDSLAVVRRATETAAGGLLSAAGARTTSGFRAAGMTAEQQLSAAVAALNVRVAGRSLFAGEAFSDPALAEPATLMAALESLTAGATTAAEVDSALGAYFAPGGDFETAIYGGSADPPAGVPVAEGETAGFSVTAADAGLRDSLRGLAMGALLGAGVLQDSPSEMADLADRAARLLLGSAKAVVDLAGEVGAVEARIEDSVARNRARRTALAVDLQEQVAADPYETASALQDTENGLNALYLATSRLAGLSLTRFLR